MKEWIEDEIQNPEEIELHNPEMTDILGEPPAWLLRGGSYLFMGIVCLLLVGLYWLDYPHIIKVPVTIGDKNAVEWIISPADGILDSLWIEDGETVTPNMTLGNIKQSNMLHPLQSIGEGKVYIGPHWSLKQKVCAGDTICAIVSADKSQPEGRLFLTSGQTANLHIGDSALIELDKYPSRKYGYLIGCTKEISFVPNRHCYAVSIQIPYPLITTSGHTVDYEVEQTGIVRFSEKRKIKFLK